MKQQIIITCILSGLLFSCTSPDKKSHNIKAATNPTADTIVANQKSVDEATIPPLVIADSGQQYFKVAVTKNNLPLAQYEGDFPIPLFADNLFTLQLPANKRMLKISHLLVLYFNSPAEGTFPIAPSGNVKGKPTLIFTPVTDGSYGIGIAADTGTVVITDYSEKTLSGSINATGKDTDGNKINIQAAFINLKNNDLNK